ncbi:hypothetical protein Tco_1205494, partial [Tanacetum coccineum]
NMRKPGKGFSGRVTPLFPSMLLQNKAPEGERGDSVERAITTDASLVAAQDNDNIIRTQTTAMPNVDIPQGIDAEGNTSGSGEGRMEQTFELMDIVPLTPHDSPLPGGYTPGSDEGRLKLGELMAMCKKLSKQVLDLEKEKDAQAVEILNLKKRVKKLERKRNSSISHSRKRIYRHVESFDDSLDEEDASKQGGKVTRQSQFNNVSIDVSVAEPPTVSTAGPSTSATGTSTGILEDEMVTMADTLIAIRQARTRPSSLPRTTSVVFHDVEEEPRRSIPAPPTQPSSKDKGKTIMVEPKMPLKNLRKAQIQMDEELAMRLHEEEKAKLERMKKERATQEEASMAALYEEYDTIQASINVDALFAARL